MDYAQTGGPDADLVYGKESPMWIGCRGGLWELRLSHFFILLKVSAMARLHGL
jgi:hypothetical protein